jgi:membrane protein DedA with SNARE-associated domain
MTSKTVLNRRYPMSSIRIADLRPVGYDLFSSSESFMSDLTEDELGIQGGGFWATVAATLTSAPSIVISIVGASVGLSIAYTIYHK